MLSESHGQTRYLTGLRGYAALMVFFTHFGAVVTAWGTPFEEIREFGKFGVCIFFVLSAYLICAAIERTPQFKFKDYMLRRFFRIAPLYYFACIAAYKMPLEMARDCRKIFPVPVDLKGLWLHLSFANYFDDRYRGSLMGVEWTVPLEMWIYLLLPVVYSFMKKSVVANRFILIWILFAIHNHAPYIMKLMGMPYQTISHYWWSIEFYAFSFALGCLAFFIQKSTRRWETARAGVANVGSDWMALMLFVFLYVYIINPISISPVAFVSVWTALLLLVIPFCGRYFRYLFENEFIFQMGKISFSIYLMQAFIYELMWRRGIPKNTWIYFIGSFIVLVALSYLTYYTIERPFLKLSEKWGSKSNPV